MTDETYKYCEHHTYGVGSAMLTLYKEGRDNPKKKRTKTVRKKELNLGDLLDSFK